MEPLSQQLHSGTVRTKGLQRHSIPRSHLSCGEDVLHTFHNHCAAQTKSQPLSTPTSPPQKPEAHATAPATGMVRARSSPLSWRKEFAVCPISRVNHLRPLSSDIKWPSIDERRTKQQNACSLDFWPGPSSAASLDCEKASDFCRCTLPVCIKCLSTASMKLARWKTKTVSERECFTHTEKTFPAKAGPGIRWMLEIVAVVCRRDLVVSCGLSLGAEGGRSVPWLRLHKRGRMTWFF